MVAETEDRILGGRLLIRQPAIGYRVNIDTILLAAAVAPAATLLEAGCGVGAAALAVAWREPNTRITGIERDAQAVSLARGNARANGLDDRVHFEAGDILDYSVQRGPFEGAFFNPPFNAAHEGNAPADARKAALVEETPLDAWVAALADRLTGGATLTFIHRAERIAEILAALEGRLGGVEILPVLPRADAPAKRVIVNARKGSRAPLRLLGGLVLHDPSGAKHTPEVEAILRGEAFLARR